MRTEVVWGEPGSVLFERCYALWVRRSGANRFEATSGARRPVTKSHLARVLAPELGLTTRNLRLYFRERYSHRIAPAVMAKVEALLRHVDMEACRVQAKAVVVQGEEHLGPQIECAKCGETWPADNEFYRDGASKCLACEFEEVTA